MMKRILAVGGDRRQSLLAGLLRDLGAVDTLAVPDRPDTAAPGMYDLLILPTPTLDARGYIRAAAPLAPATLLPYCGASTRVFGGALNGGAGLPVKSERIRIGRRRRKAALPDLDLPENKPRRPDLHAANLSFAARVIIWVRDRYANNAPAIYKAAYLSRKTYSAIISDENHGVSKRTAIQLAFALRLTREEADLLLHAAGYHLSRSVVEDMIFDACLEANIHSLEDVNQFLLAYECRPFVPQT